MSVITAKQLKRETGGMLKRVRAGERLTVTHRGKPVAVILPLGEAEEQAIRGLRNMEEAWQDIELTLENTLPEFEGWQEATRWARKRTFS